MVVEPQDTSNDHNLHKIAFREELLDFAVVSG